MACAHASPLAEESLETILRCLKPGEMSSLLAFVERQVQETCWKSERPSWKVASSF